MYFIMHTECGAAYLHSILVLNVYLVDQFKHLVNEKYFFLHEVIYDDNHLS